MTRVVFIDVDGGRSEVDAIDGLSLMEVARAAGVAAIEGQCGGLLSCATCHVYVDDAWAARLPPPDALERDMIPNVIEPRPSSRLCCQIKVAPALDGLVVHTPERQS
jgi:2Fe-2S ferredoxin